MNEPTIVTTQARGRLTLGALATASQYIVHSEADGVLVLEPATVLSVTEKKLLENSALMAAIQDSREHPEKMVKRDRAESPRA
ncbi:MAG TPA: hypothetical protein VII67_01735 [Acidimicrobiales bacterium]